jgi:hypothetical protein
MALLPGPYEIFDIADGESVDLLVTRIERGDEFQMTATDGHTFMSSPLRLHLVMSLAPGKHPYLDITSKRLIPRLEGLLSTIPGAQKHIKITKHGVAPTAVFTVDVLP